MKSSRHLSLLLLCLAWLGLVSCSDDRSPGRPGESLLRPNVPGATLLHGSAGGRLLLYGVPARRLAPETTSSPAYRLRVVGSRGQARAAASGDPLVLDAVLDQQGRRAAMVLTGGRLRITGQVLPADLPRANPGLAFSRDGRRLAFVCGLAPETEVCLVELPSGRWRVLAGGHGPQDRPAFTADDRGVLFVSAAGGVAAIWQIGLGRGAVPTQLTNRGLSSDDVSGPRFLPLPLGPQPLVHTGRAMVFDSGEGVVRLVGGAVQAVAPAGTLALPGAGGVTLVRPTARGPRLEVAP